MQIHADLRELSKLRKFLQQIFETEKVSETESYAVIWAVDESCSNIIQHGYGGDSSKKIWISVTVSSDQIAIEIEDEGPAFDLRTVADTDLQLHKQQGKRRGLGIFILRKLVDRVNYHGKSSDDARNKLVLIKKRHYTSDTIPS